MRRAWILLCFAVITSLSACSLFGQDEGAEDGVQNAATPLPAASPSAQETPGTIAPITITETGKSLRVWIPPEISQRTAEGAAELSEQLTAFASSRPDVTTRIEAKPEIGTGGILNYLRTGHVVAPSVLPDLIALPVEHLASAVTEGLVYPFDDVLDQLLLEDLYPAALAIARPNGQTLGYPFALTGLSHLVYRTSAITGTVSTTWDGLSNSLTGQFILPASGEAGAIFALQFYLESGGSLTNEVDVPALQIETLTAVLETLRRSREGNFMALQSSNVATYDEAWQIFEAGAAVAMPTTADHLLKVRTQETSPGFAQIPGTSGALTPLVRGWVWAISTADPAQKKLAVELLSALVADPALGEWSAAAKALPSRRSAMALWNQSDPYVRFLTNELERARPFPPAASGVVITAIEDAVFDVISLSSTPSSAAEAAARIVRP